MDIEIKNLFNLDETLAKDLLNNHTYPWECLPKIHDFIIQLGKSLDKDIYEEREENVWIAKSAKIAPTASITGPVIIDENAEIRHCAFIRGDVIVGKSAVVGNSVELKNSILFNETEVPHFNYVGDSILGYKSHMGAGSITSNIKSDKKDIIIKFNKNIYNYSDESNYLYKSEEQNINIETHLAKVGAFLGDFVEVGCNSVLNPGTIIGKNSSVYPLSSVRGVIPENSIYKNKDKIVKKV